MFIPIDTSSIECNGIMSDSDKVFEFLVKLKLDQFQNIQGEPCLKSPVSPSNWLYFATRDDDDFFFGDLYDWRNKSKNKSATNRLFRFYPKSVIEKPVDGKVSNAKFTRCIYMPNFPAKKSDPILIIYRGDHKIIKNVPHGNAKIGRAHV